MNIWRLVSFHEEAQKATITQRYVENGRIAIGWGNIGPLDQYHSKDNIGEAIRDSYPHLSNSNIGGPSLWHLFANMRVGDSVVIDAKKEWERVVEVAGEYEWNNRLPNVAGHPDYFHQRIVIPRDDIQASQLRLITGSDPAAGQARYLALFHCGSYTTNLEQ